MAPGPGPRPRLSVSVVAPDDYVRRGVAADLRARPRRYGRVDAHNAVADVWAGPLPDLVVLGSHPGHEGTGGADVVRSLVEAGALVVLHTAEERPVLLREVVRAGAHAVAHQGDGREALLSCLEHTRAGTVVFSSDLVRALATDPHCAPSLSPRLVEALEQVAAGATRQEAASRMGISQDTLGDYLAAVRTRYLGCGRDVTNTVSLVREAVRDGYLPRPAHVGPRVTSGGEPGLCRSC